MEFFETIMGKRFFEHQLPRLIAALQQIANALENENPPFFIPEALYNPDAAGAEGDFLDQLYYGTLQTGVAANLDCLEKGRQEILFALEKLEGTLSKEQWPFYLQYNAAVNQRNSEANRVMFRQGYCLAVQLISAGWTRCKKGINKKEKK